MTQFSLNTNTDTVTLQRDVLRLMARHPSLEAAIPPMLQAAKTVTQANAGFFLIFDLPRWLSVEGITETDLPEDDDLFQLANNLQHELAVSTELPSKLAQYTSALFIPLRGKKHVLALLGLLFTQDFQLPTDLADALITLRDGLMITTMSARTVEHHQKTLRNQNEFVRITTHDLRQPLTVLKGIVSMMEAGVQGNMPLEDKLPNFVEKMASGVYQMEFLVDNIQDAGRYDPETGFYEMQRAPADVTDLVNKIVKNYLKPAEKQELMVSVDASDDVPIINIDAQMLERAITNLVDNAIKYTPNGGKIQVVVRRVEDKVVVSVKDNGFGISPENMRGLFQRHFRIRRREHNRVKGSGLGLFIVRSVAQQHGGDAWVESVEGEGSTFSISLPIAGANLIGGGSAVD